MNYKSRTIPTKEPVIISVHEWLGQERFDIRHYYIESRVEKGLMPTTKEISIPVKDAPAVIAAILQVLEKSRFVLLLLFHRHVDQLRKRLYTMLNVYDI